MKSLILRLILRLTERLSAISIENVAMSIMKQDTYYTNITNFEINDQYRYSNDTFFTSRRFLCISITYRTVCT